MDPRIWFHDNYIEIFGAITGIVYVFLEIRQNIWLWPVGIITSAVYIWVFLINKFYADMSLQVYYLVISCLGWYWWTGRQKRRDRNEKTDRPRDTGKEGEGKGKEEIKEFGVTRLNRGTGVILTLVFILLYGIMRLILTELTDSPVPGWDSLITSMSVIATWMLARKIYEHWFLWIVVNFVSAILFFTRGLYPTVMLYFIYGIMSFVGLIEWKKAITQKK